MKVMDLSVPYFAFSALSQKRIDLKSMLGVYVVMAVGVGLAFMALIAEILWKKRAAKLKMIKFKRFVIFFMIMITMILSYFRPLWFTLIISPLNSQNSVI